MPDLSVVVCLAFDPRSTGDELAKFKDCICRCPFVQTTLMVSGTFDMIAHGKCESLLEYSQHMESIRPAISRFVRRLETNFIWKRVDKDGLSADTLALWLPCKDGHRHVEARRIDKVLAEGDYVRVHVGDWQCLVHSTMRKYCSILRNVNFIQLHRSSLVRIDFIESLAHDARGWTACLRDGTRLRVAKRHVKSVLSIMAADAPNETIPKQTVATRDAQRVDCEAPVMVF